MVKTKRIIILLYIVVFSLLSTSVGVIFYCTLSHDKTHHKLEKAIEKHHQAFLLADQLRQTSDDLTRMVRSYAVTGEEKYKNAFYKIHDIRAGKVPRPINYDQVYWDFKLVDPQFGREVGKPASLKSLMVTLGLTPTELDLLAKAESRSNDLSKLERISVNAMEGLYRDKQGNFTVAARPDRRLARQILFSPGYHEAKREIMAPINDFLLMLDERLSREINTAHAELERIQALQRFFSYLLVICVPFVFVLSMRYQKISDIRLAESEERFKALSDASYGGVIIHDQGKILDCNRGLTEITGFSMNELIGMDGLQLIEPQSLDRVLQNIKEGYEKRYEVEGVRKDGSIYPLSIQGKNIFYMGKEARVIEFRDITDVKTAEIKLKQNEVRQRAMVENIHDVIAIIDRDGINRFKSPNIKKWFGWEPGDVVDTPAWDNVHPEDLDTVQSIFSKLTTHQGMATNGECRYLCRDGSYRWIEFNAVNCLDNPNIDGILLSYRDISERKKMLSEQRRSAQLAALGTVAAGVAHEINNPIQGIMNYATLIGHAPENTDRVNDLSERIIKESKRIVSITKDLLYYSKDSSLQLVISDIQELIEGALALLAAKLRRHGVFVETFFSVNLPQIAVQPQGLQQIIINLVDNAYDAIRDKGASDPEKIIRIDADVVKVNHRSYLLIQVQDHGTGMSTEVIERAREAFFSTKPSAQGTGLGLSIVNDIVTSHNGFLEIESRLGEYTKIMVYLPAEPTKTNQ